VHALVVGAEEMFGGLFPVVDPIGNVAVFVGLTAGFAARDQLRVARNSALIVFGLLAAFLFLGEPILHHFHVSFESLQIAGGVVVGLVGLKTVLEEGSIADARSDGRGIAFSPMAMPILAGPAAMAMVLALEARVEEETTHRVFSVFGFLIGIALLAAVVFVCFAFADRLSRLLGRSGLDAIHWILGLLMIAIGVELIVHGVVNHPVAHG
jgi:multiple antibiotic resistance protein